MDSSDSCCFDIFEIYTRYCDITSGAIAHVGEGYWTEDEHQKAKFSREALAQLSKMVESRLHPRVSVFDEVFRLMSRLDLMVDFSEFSRFYDFVFFICRENGQKNITVSRAVMAWRLILAGRFQLLNQWCDFVEKYQRHNISEDTWRQVFAFSRCVHENLEEYDPEGAWPVLIDDFVEHMYSTAGSNDSPNVFCNCGDIEPQPFEDSLSGLRVLPSLKRKLLEDFTRDELEITTRLASVDVRINAKRRHVSCADRLVSCGDNATVDSMDIVKNNSLLGCSKSPCAVEGCLSRGFAGLLSTRSCLQFDRERRESPIRRFFLHK